MTTRYHDLDREYLTAQKEALQAFLLSHRAQATTSFYAMAAERFGVTRPFFKYATSYRHPHSTVSRVDSAWEIIEAGTFSLPLHWTPGQVISVDSESCDFSSKSYPVCVQFGEGDTDRVMGLSCECTDFDRGKMCKHLCCYFLLTWAYRATGAVVEAAVVESDPVKDALDIFGDF